VPTLHPLGKKRASVLQSRDTPGLACLPPCYLPAQPGVDRAQSVPWPSFLRGYTGRRPLAAADEAAIAPLVVLGELWLMGGRVDRVPDWRILCGMVLRSKTMPFSPWTQFRPVDPECPAHHAVVLVVRDFGAAGDAEAPVGNFGL
jgi:hypothetical protein